MITIQHHDSQQAPSDLALGTTQLIYADPPFNLGVDYGQYDDRLKSHEYRRFAGSWVHAMARLLRPGGWFVICTPSEWQFEYESLLRAEDLQFHQHVIWHRTFGAQSQSGGSLSKAHTTLLVYGRPLRDERLSKPHWDRVRVASARQTTYADKRACPDGKIPGTVWQLPDDPGSTVWTVSMVCGTYKERVGWCPCQQPLRLVTRVVAALSDEQDLVVDPFSGAATTAVACRILGRKCISYDIDPKYVEHGRQRVAGIHDELAVELRDGLVPRQVTMPAGL